MTLVHHSIKGSPISVKIEKRTSEKSTLVYKSGTISSISKQKKIKKEVSTETMKPIKLQRFRLVKTNTSDLSSKEEII